MIRMGLADSTSTSSLRCQRLDLSRPAMVFAGVFIAAAAYSGLGASGTGMVDEVRVLGNENSVGPHAVDPHALNCDRELARAVNAHVDPFTHRVLPGGTSTRCRKHRTT